MVSRPLVAATAAGGFVGQPVQGLLIGVVLELIALETLPFGASRYPEWGSAAVVGGALFSDAAPSQAGGLTIAVLSALATAWVGGISMVKLREQNARWARARQPLLERGSGRTVIGLQVAGLTADLVRGGLLTFVALAVLRPLAHFALTHWGARPPISRAFVIAVAATVASAAVWKIFHATAGARWLFAGGVAAGLLLLAIR
jgi:mannose/fructose/N-acetylgalactosamine-specific phosphotransferase system component IIC